MSAEGETQISECDSPPENVWHLKIIQSCAVTRELQGRESFSREFSQVIQWVDGSVKPMITVQRSLSPWSWCRSTDKEKILSQGTDACIAGWTLGRCLAIDRLGWRCSSVVWHAYLLCVEPWV